METQGVKKTLSSKDGKVKLKVGLEPGDRDEVEQEVEPNSFFGLMPIWQSAAELPEILRLDSEPH
jgi:hypothetical protein